MTSLDWLKQMPGDGVYSLSEAQNSLLQVLLPRFELYRAGYGKQLDVAFDGNSDTIRRRQAKDVVQKRMPDYESKFREIQACLDDVIFGSEKEYIHRNPNFAFRYASGGTLPIIERDGIDYYCLFYRDVFPVGWNIANGATDSQAELLNPKLAIERELREELIILDRHSVPHWDYQFSWEGQNAVAVPEFVEARTLWSRLLQLATPIEDFMRVKLMVQWDNGPDSVRIRFDREGDRLHQGFYLNINAEDFGIELDRIARIKVDRKTVLLDGEVNDNQLLNRPVGLFEVQGTQRALLRGDRQFLPDRLFHWAGHVPQRLRSDFDTLAERIILGDFFSYLLKKKIRTETQIKEWRRISKGRRFSLCPVTRQIIHRHIQTLGVQVFLSYAHQDQECAEALQDDLRAKGIEVWRDRNEIRTGDRLDRAIEEAIKRSTHFVLLATEAAVNRNFVRDEIAFARKKNKPAVVLRRGSCELPLQASGWLEIPLGDACRAPDQLVVALRRAPTKSSASSR